VRTLARRLGLLALMASLWPSAALAQEKRDPVAADYLFREARKAARAGDYAKACPLFADSLKADGGTGVLMNLADCEEHLGKVASAWEHWREALDSLQGKSDKRAALARRKIAALDKRLPRLTLRLDAGAPSESRVERDGVELGASALGLPVPVDPGSHTIVVRAPKHENRTFTVAIREAQLVEQNVGAGAAQPEKPVAGGAIGDPGGRTGTADPPARTGGGTKPIAYALLGIGVVGIGVGAVAGIVALDKKSTVQQHCQSDPAGGVACTDQTGLDAASSGRTMSTVSTIGFAAGAASVAVGVLLLVMSGGRSGGTSTALAPSVLPGGGGFTFARTF
jgi:hypothetical protein